MASVVDGLTTIATVLFWTIELALFALVHFMMSKFSGGADLGTMVLVFVAPIITYGHMKVHNCYSARQIRVNSALKGLFGTPSMDAMLDTGASAHVTNTMSYMSNATADNSFSLVGVNGADSQMTCSYAGYLNIYLSAKTFDSRPNRREHQWRAKRRQSTQRASGVFIAGDSRVVGPTFGARLAYG